MPELIIDYLRDDNASLRAELVRRFEQAEALKKTLADTAEALRLYVECYAKADDRIGVLKKENDGLRTRNKDVYTALLAANDSTADMRKERDSALSERVALKKENEALKADAEAWKKEKEEIKGKPTSVELLIEARERTERQRWENIYQVFGAKFPTQMNEGESAAQERRK